MEKFVELFLNNEDNMQLLSSKCKGQSVKFLLSRIDSRIATNWTNDRFKLLEKLIYLRLQSIDKQVRYVDVSLVDFQLMATIYV